MWPAALVIGMFVLLGAMGTATAPTAHAAEGDTCNQEGPFPNFLGPGADDVGPGPWNNNFLLEGFEYLVVLYVEDDASAARVESAAIDVEPLRCKPLHPRS